MIVTPSATVAAFKNLVDSEIAAYTKIMGEAREQAVDRMAADATAKGANAITEVQFAIAYMMDAASETFAYGCATVVEVE